MELKQDSLESAGMTRFVSSSLVSVPDPKPTPVRIAFSILRVILEVIYAPGEVWGWDYFIMWPGLMVARDLGMKLDHDMGMRLGHVVWESDQDMVWKS